tara:strand:- start:606 stop:1763 length:1158 start_codon:yes stop_codon:yes gene_type:complete
MPDIEKLNDVATGSIEAVNGVSKANIQAINGVGVPAAATGASRWVVVTGAGYVATCANSDRTSWSSYDGTDSSTPKGLSIAFGKNNSGADIYICTRDASAREIQVSGSDVTTDAVWTDVNIDHKQFDIMWGARSDGTAAGTWVAVGDDASCFRSTDGGANWSEIDLTGLSGHSTTPHFKGIASNGSGKWMMAQDGNLYVSTNDAASFAISTPWGTDTPVTVQGICYTNSTWVIAYSRGSAPRLRSCADSDTTDWSDEYTVNDISGSSMANSGGDTSSDFVRMAAASGRVCFLDTGDNQLTYVDVNGKTISNGGFVDLASSPGSMSGDVCQDIATDGTTWLMSMKGGDVLESTDNGESWSRIVNDLTISSSQRDLNAITCDVVLPL